MTALAIRRDRSPGELRVLAAQSDDARVARRLLALANALDGMERAEAAALAGMERQALRDVVVRYNAEGVAGLQDRHRSGRPPKLTDGQMASLKAEILVGPDPERDGRSRYRVTDIRALVADRYGVHYSKSGMLGVLHALDLSWQKARPCHPLADTKAQEAYKKGA